MGPRDGVFARQGAFRSIEKAPRLVLPPRRFWFLVTRLKAFPLCVYFLSGRHAGVCARTYGGGVVRGDVTVVGETLLLL